MRTMKKCLLVAGTMLAALTANAQQGSWYAGGDVGFSSKKVKYWDGNSSMESDKSNSWKFSPEIGTFLTDNVQLGIGLSLNGSESDNVKTSQTGGTVYSRYFFGSGSFRPFAGLNVSILPGKQTFGNGTSPDVRIFTFGTNVNAGFAYALSPKVTAVGSFGAFGFSSNSGKLDGSDEKYTETSFGLDAGTLGSRFTIGIYYTFK